MAHWHVEMSSLLEALYCETSLAMGEFSYPRSVSGWKVCVEVDSIVELMFSHWDVFVEGSISPLALVSIFGEVGAGVLNSKAR